MNQTPNKSLQATGAAPSVLDDVRDSLLLCVLEILQWFHVTEHSHIHFLLIMLVMTLLGFERYGFSRLLLAREREIERLRHESKDSA
jgi:hypothetical protein